MIYPWNMKYRHFKFRNVTEIKSVGYPAADGFSTKIADLEVKN